MKRILPLFILGMLLYSCSGPHRCPTYADSGAKWSKKGGHPYKKY